MGTDPVRARLVLWATVLALAVAGGLVDRPGVGPALIGAPAIGLGLFVLLARGRPRLPRKPRRMLVARGAYLVGSALFEELVWRAGALGLLARHVGSLSALALTSGTFAFWHRGRLGARSAVHVVTGAGFGVAFLWGGLPAAALAHGTYNVLVELAVQAESRTPEPL